MNAARGKKIFNLLEKTDQVHSRSIYRNLADQKGVAGYILSAGLEKYTAKNSVYSEAVIQNRRRDKEFS